MVNIVYFVKYMLDISAYEKEEYLMLVKVWTMWLCFKKKPGGLVCHEAGPADQWLQIWMQNPKWTNMLSMAHK